LGLAGIRGEEGSPPLFVGIHSAELFGVYRGALFSSDGALCRAPAVVISDIKQTYLT